MENGFTEDEAAAMSWICRQKAAGKFWGASTGLFLAITWGHLHERLIQYVPFSFNRRLTQLGIIMVSMISHRAASCSSTTCSLAAEEAPMNSSPTNCIWITTCSWPTSTPSCTFDLTKRKLRYLHPQVHRWGNRLLQFQEKPHPHQPSQPRTEKVDLQPQSLHSRRVPSQNQGCLRSPMEYLQHHSIQLQIRQTYHLRSSKHRQTHRSNWRCFRHYPILRKRMVSHSLINK